jgi:hypothetical protein
MKYLFYVFCPRFSGFIKNSLKQMIFLLKNENSGDIIVHCLKMGKLILNKKWFAGQPADFSRKGITVYVDKKRSYTDKRLICRSEEIRRYGNKSWRMGAFTQKLEFVWLH